MHILDYLAIGALIVCMLIAAAKALSLGKDRGARWPL
jgi:hypothetical protein